MLLGYCRQTPLLSTGSGIEEREAANSQASLPSFHLNAEVYMALLLLVSILLFPHDDGQSSNIRTKSEQFGMDSEYGARTFYPVNTYNPHFFKV
jgi:hypothetical protein